MLRNRISPGTCSPFWRNDARLATAPGSRWPGCGSIAARRSSKGSKSGAVITPGDSSKSRLLDRISSSKPGFKMPPAGAPLSEAEIATIKAWIDSGAKAPAVTATATGRCCQSSGSDSCRTEARLGSQPDRRVCSRPAGIREDRTVARSFEDDALAARSARPDGVAANPERSGGFPERQAVRTRTNALVDRLLASPHYGEKWARQWLDLARYADSDGYEKDLVRPCAWRYRNWVIDAINADMPFDEFTVEQMAGDLLPNANVEQRVATGFHRNVLTNREAGVDRAEARFEQNINRTDTIGTVWLG